MSARGIRNNNPGNIEVSGWTQRQAGYTGPEPQGRFATFDTMAHGVEALLRLLLVYRDQHGLTTVRGIINRWAPPKENETSAYARSVSITLGTDVDQVLPRDAELYEELAQAIVRVENGADASKVAAADYKAAIKQVFPQAPAVSPTDDADAVGSPSPAPPPPAAGPTPAFPRGTGDDPFPAWPFPPTESTMPLPAAAAVALGAELLKLLPMFSSGSKTAERNVAAAQALGGKLLEVAKDVATGQPNEQARVEAILASPELQTRFRAQVAAKWDDVAPFLEYESKERAAARQFAVQMTSEGPAWRQIGYGALVAILSLVIVGGIGYIFWNVLFAEASSFSQSTRDGIVEVAKNVLILVVGFFFGSSASNRQKDQTISEQAKRQ